MLDNSIDHLHPDLVRVYKEAKAAYIAAHPATPANPLPYRPRLNETSRTAALQNAYYQQGRNPDTTAVNALRKAAGTWSIDAEENKLKITNAHYGQSAHNFLPARAWDVAFVNAKGGYVDSPELYRGFWKFVQAAAQKFGVAVTWGGAWGDAPHVELTHWRTL